ncbi:hypothetical protein COM90_29415 [Bacillus thuringiensis]|uniref:Uncharacterized protein n=1 Tax=Bacillus thuringiensis TaxID=1428 RepID=A0AB36TMP5_BACTU|nr:hypothetical protein COM74_21165 [Bacillus thuringiensis]PEE85274.1 hypothetical protein COM90_29415 [Bacillus thuringiensis]PFM85245.1 hypothetical protein COJ61_27850 [Bacillus thuringiensis]
MFESALFYQKAIQRRLPFYFSTPSTWYRNPNNGNIKVPSVVECLALLKGAVFRQGLLNLSPTKIAFSL